MVEDKKYFNVRIEFDRDKLDRTIFKAIEDGTPGYSCSVESNNLTVANKNPEFLKVLNGALVNNCDGSVLAKILGRIHHEPIDSYIGADIFLKYISMRRFRQFFLGNTEEVLAGLKKNLTKIDPKIKDMRFETLPFRAVEDFDYQGIADMINADNPDIIWVSLGAPKQEMFMARLKPFLKRGIMFGYGAIFNFNAGVGDVKRAPKWMLKLRLEWLHRALEQPKKNIPRYWNFIKILPRLVKEERRKVALIDQR
ncbi:MAG: WecB/TagA/CpsF family glycosyltransferase [Duncaniella sp.]|uniref:WecB/TagA/CpsF family glycosyltransferase n=1 Tax=Duncaniella sp. TaxID=2518496 RepID=UPI0023D6AF27|nr:WecB/TagA/CpsF family glycosyltransferase [Duncaniella sp.]MDE6090868.1 WecB/TagA/CpsF family glycosyltransferase [Duncaniella sp.]